jgi:hypothetical protein
MAPSSLARFAPGLVLALALALGGCAATPADGDATGEGARAINSKEITTAAPPGIVSILNHVATPPERWHCLGTLVGRRSVLTSARCTEDQMKDLAETLEVRPLTSSGVSSTRGIRGTRVDPVPGGAGLVLITVAEDLGTPATLPGALTATDTPVRIYGNGADDDRTSRTAPIGKLQSRELPWGRASSAASWTLEIGAPLYEGNTLVGLVVDSRAYSSIISWTYTWAFGTDVVAPLVPRSGSLEVVDAIRRAAAEAAR